MKNFFGQGLCDALNCPSTKGFNQAFRNPSRLKHCAAVREGSRSECGRPLGFFGEARSVGRTIPLPSPGALLPAPQEASLREVTSRGRFLCSLATRMCSAPSLSGPLGLASSKLWGRAGSFAARCEQRETVPHSRAVAGPGLLPFPPAPLLLRGRRRGGVGPLSASRQKR